MEEKRNVPNLRFPGFTDPWEQRKLGELSAIKTGSSDLQDAVPGGDYPFFVRSDEVERSNHYLYDGEAILVPGEGRLGEIFHYIVGKFDYHQRVYKISDFDGIRGKFVYHAMRNSFKEHALRNTAKATVDSIRLPTLTEFEFYAPSSDEEQRLVASSLDTLDNLITLHQRELDHVKELKKGLLQKMFPKEGANVPELRFPGFTDPWEQRRLGELCSFAKGRGYSKIDIRDSGVPLILYGRLYTQYQTKIEEVDTFTVEKDGSLLSKGNEVIVPASGETAEDIAVASSVRRPGIIFGGDLNVLTPGDALDPDYVALGITYGSAHSNLAKRAQGKSVVHVHNADIAMTELAYPSIDEQRAISILVLKLDSLIALHQRELDHVKELKKGLLQQMFV